MHPSENTPLLSPNPRSSHHGFKTGAATDDAGELGRRSSIAPEPEGAHTRPKPHHSESNPSNPYEPVGDNSTPEPHRHELTRRLLGSRGGSDDTVAQMRRRSISGRRRSITMSHSQGYAVGDQLEDQMPEEPHKSHSHHKPGLVPRPIGGDEKLGMFSGVFVPTSLNVLSILMFLRFGFILGQGGVVGMMGMLIVAYVINLLTTLSLSAIASNGTVRGGGAYYLISRSLGPEFGGSIGVVFYMGFVFNTGMNAVGLIDCFNQNFGAISGNWARILPEHEWWSYLWATVVLVLCTLICLGGSAIFARASNGLLAILMIATLSIPFSALFQQPFESRALGVEFTGLSLDTFKGNLMPRLTRGAAGSQLPGRETFQDLFGILFPATGGIFAGASMSGDLKNPSKSIPKGTLYGLAMTFVTYTLVILAMAATITRASFVRDVNVIQDTNISAMLVLAGEFASTFFSTLMGVIGSAKLLQALARDHLIPGLSVFGQGTKKADEPIYAIIITYIVAQFTMLLDINQIASFTTMTYLMTFLVMNLACFLLKISAAPNFRPSFHFFTWQTAFVGTLVSGAAMFFVDGVYATACVGILVFIFLLIHYTTPPKSWGDVSQSLIYHQCRKYLLRLKQEHVKFWRPQILLFVNDPRRQYKLIQFCNSMKKGALYVLGHVIVSSDFGGAVPEARKQQAAWTKYIDFSRVKAFVQIAISPAVEWGTRNIVLSAGLGGMRPNIAVLGFYNLQDLNLNKPLIDMETPEDSVNRTNAAAKFSKHDKNQKLDGLLPTDDCKREDMMSVTSYVTILEDLLLRVQINVAVARGFQALEFPNPRGENRKKFIDLWPIQMSAEIVTEGENKPNVLTTNFDTYTLILQLGCILNTVPDWKKVYKLRVAVFVEYESDVEEERGRVKTLLENLRIEAEILVFWLASGELKTYEIIVNGNSTDEESEKKVEDCLRGEDWWEELQIMRGKRFGVVPPAGEDLADIEGLFPHTTWPDFQKGPHAQRVERFLGLRKLLKRPKRRQTMSGLTKLGLSLGMRTHRLAPQLINRHISAGSSSEESSSSSDSESDIEVFEDDESVRSGRESAASEGDVHDYETDSDREPPSPAKITRRRSHGDSLRGPPPSKKSTGEKEPKVPEPSSRKPSAAQSTSSTITSISPKLDAQTLEQIAKGQGSKTSSLSDIKASLLSQGMTSSASASKPPSISGPQAASKTPSIAESTPSLLKSPYITASDSVKNKQPLRPTPKARPSMSRLASTPKFSSKPVPVTKVATEDGPGPSIMFTDTPSPPTERKKKRLPSAYKASPVFPDHISEVSENAMESGDGESGNRRPDHGRRRSTDRPTPYPSQLNEDSPAFPFFQPTTNTNPDHSPASSTTPSPNSNAPNLSRSHSYSTQHLPLTFNDLPRRAQHLILNELMSAQSTRTAVLFTTLPSPVEGTCESEEECLRYLGDLEVLARVRAGVGEVPVLLVHSNSMTVTMNL